MPANGRRGLIRRLKVNLVLDIFHLASNKRRITSLCYGIYPSGSFLCSADRPSLYDLVNRTNLGHNIFLICLLLFSACFGQLCANHQEKIRYLCDTWYLSRYIDDCLVCRAEWIPPCIPDSHLYRVTNTRCRIGTVFSPDDGHIVARNM